MGVGQNCRAYHRTDSDQCNKEIMLHLDRFCFCNNIVSETHWASEDSVHCRGAGVINNVSNQLSEYYTIGPGRKSFPNSNIK